MRAHPPLTHLAKTGPYLRLSVRISSLFLVTLSLNGYMYSKEPLLLVCHLCDLATAVQAPNRTRPTDFVYTPSINNPSAWSLHATSLTPGSESPLAARSTWLTQGGINLWPEEEKSDAQEPPNSQKQKQPETHNPSATANSPGHIFWVIPAYKVDYGKGFQPLTAKEKFQEWAKGAYDPLGLGWSAFEAATIEYAPSDGFCGYGHGWPGYGKCYGALQLDANDSSFIGDFLLSVLFHQDPRYFRLGEGSIGRRVWYAAARVFVTRNDSGRAVVDTSALAGTAIAAALSNLYYPSKEVNASHTMTRIAIDLGNTALYNAAAEFWPEIHRVVQHIF